MQVVLIIAALLRAQIPLSGSSNTVKVIIIIIIIITSSRDPFSNIIYGSNPKITTADSKKA
jgi:hypothetical protein